MSTKKTRIVGLLSLVAMTVAGAFVSVACDSESNAVKEPMTQPTGTPTSTTGNPGTTNDGGGPDNDGGPSDCVQNPQTHDEIINACTDAVRIAKNPKLPLQHPDGGLPTPP
ncbi:hypothetical protein AKJ09_08235 [Labilithrix luteola]|uniref:Secreted protein n=1 Tax=Labilithrix luteola TaxID=1391654 RepID=A0A0K1Q7C7_9BACT|nr:hypothetical protein [Labilithrix luteola]AKV01572.1 hypothetical protein AKJ09_08235 [Labilithrix luteola]